MKVMEFLKPIDCYEENPHNVINTIRRGTKWGNLSVGERILIQHPDTSMTISEGAEYPMMMSLGEVANVRVKMFCDIEETDLKYNFEYECRSYSGIKKRMAEIYPKFDIMEIVTIVDVEVLQYDFKRYENTSSETEGFDCSNTGPIQ